MADYNAFACPPLTHASSAHPPTVAAKGSGGSASVTNYRMSGARVSDSEWIQWSVTTTPDTTGTFAPQPVTTATITVLRKWVT